MGKQKIMTEKRELITVFEMIKEENILFGIAKMLFGIERKREKTQQIKTRCA